MADDLFESFRETGEITLELQRKAAESRARGESRRSFFRKTAALAGSTAMGVAGLRVLRPATAFALPPPACSDAYNTILDIAATAESLATTFYIQALESKSLRTVNSVANRNYFQAALTQEYIHLEILESLGAAPLATSFYFPDDMFTLPGVFYKYAGLLEDFFISAYISAAKEFSGITSSAIKLAKPISIGLAMQIAGIECEHRALLRVANNESPPNLFEIEPVLVKCVSDAATALGPFLSGGSGFATTATPAPSMSDINTIASPYDFAFFKPIAID